MRVCKCSSVVFPFLLLLLTAGPIRALPSHQWSQRFGITGSGRGQCVTTDVFGNIIVAGYLAGTADFGGGVLTSAGSQDVVVAKFSPSGAHLWSRVFGGTDSEMAYGVATDASGNVLVTGYFGGSVDFGGGALTSAGFYDIFVAKFDADGNHIWSRAFGGPGVQLSNGIASDASGDVLMTGDSYGAIDFGGGVLASGGGTDAFIAKFDASGTHLWSRLFGDSTSQSGHSIAVDASGNVLFAGHMAGTVDFGGGDLTSVGGGDIFVAKFDSGGSHIWSRSFGGSGTDGANGVAVDGGGDVLLAGDFNGTVDFGGGALTGGGGNDIFVAKFDPSGGHLWSRSFGDSDGQRAYGVAADASGNVVVTGLMNGTVDFGGGELASAGNQDIYVAQFDPSGNHLWSRSFGDTLNDVGNGVAVDATGDIVVTGFMIGTVGFGGGDLTSPPPNPSSFLAKFGAVPVPVAVQNVAARWAGDHAEVTWSLADVVRPVTFEAMRSVGVNGPFIRLDQPEIVADRDRYVLRDRSTEPATEYRYRIAVVADNEITTSFEATLVTPSVSFALEQNHPNPFNPMTEIRFTIDQSSDVRLSVYDVRGKRVRELISRPMTPGTYRQTWDARDERGREVASGIYFYCLRAGHGTLTRKAVLLR